MTNAAPRDRRQVVASKEKRRRTRKDDIPRCESIESIPFDLANVEPTAVSPYDGMDSDRSSGSDRDRDEFIRQYNTQHHSTASEVTSANSPSQGYSAPPARVASATDLTAVEKAAENYDENNNNINKSHGQPTADDKAQDIPSCPAGDKVNDVQAVQLKHRRGSTSKNFAKLVDTVCMIAAEAFVIGCDFTRYTIRYPTPAAIFMILGSIYLVALYLELSIASAIDFIVHLVWPLSHVGLRFIEHVFKAIGQWIAKTDDLGQAVYCDLAQVWCNQFELMCENQCSFTSLAMERMRA